MISKPSFNPNSWTGRLSSQEKLRSDNDPFKPMLDKTVNAYFPGSTYKIVGALAALAEELVSFDDTVSCPGYYRFGGRRFRCWKRGGHGHVNVMEAIQGSCDVFFYHVAERLGIDTLARYAYQFGFGEHTGYPINFESPGRVPTKEWHRKHSREGYQYGFALNTVLGQGDTLVTPLQVALAYAAIANGGELYYPRIVEEVRGRDGTLLFSVPPRVRKEIPMEPDQLEAIRMGLWLAVNEEAGTAYSVRPEGIDAAGKTGTAQVHKIGRRRIANRDKAYRFRDHSWFAAYAPSDDPELVVAVFLQHAGHGSHHAAPVAMEIFEKYFARDGSRTRTLQAGGRMARAPWLQSSEIQSPEMQSPEASETQSSGEPGRDDPSAAEGRGAQTGGADPDAGHEEER
jgi:penicillin-binding protein 2